MIASPKHRHNNTATRPWRRAGSVAVTFAGLTLATACAAGTPAPGSPAGDTQGSAPNATGSPSGGQRATQGEFTIEFAKCMRANGVPSFPDPTGEPGQLGPNSGVDPGSPAYLAALNGPCKSLAPPAWVDDGSGSERPPQT